MSQIEVVGVDDSPQESIRPLRVWPLVFVAVVQLALVGLWLSPSVNNFIRFVVMMAGPLACSVAFACLLLFASGMPRQQSLPIVGVVTLLGVLAGATAAHRSGIGAWILGVPLILSLLAVGLIATRKALPSRRTTVVLGLAFVGWGTLWLTRIDGIDGAYLPELSWRWQLSPEERLLRELTDTADMARTSSQQEKWAQIEDGWSGFRGPRRDSRVLTPVSRQDWSTDKPREIWRRPVGPAWSSMAVTSGRLFTQEQRGPDEAVTCYNAETGDPIWRHTETSRFEEVVSGAGPRATPSVVDGIVYTFGARALLIALDGDTGDVLWKKDLMKEYDTELPVWGFSASPLVVDGLVVAFAGGGDQHGLVAYDAQTGDEAWSTASSGMNYGSAQLMRFHGNPQIVFVEPGTVRGLDVSSGKELWNAEVVSKNDFPMVQPQQIGDAILIVPTGDGKDVVRISVSESEGQWSSSTEWTSRYLKPSYNDFLFYDNALFGFDKQIFACIDATTGERLWKNGRYGFGQAILLNSVGQIVVAAESGALVLLDANRSDHVELGRIDAMTAKTWNHPAWHDGRLYVRNAEEMVCYELK